MGRVPHTEVREWPEGPPGGPGGVGRPARKSERGQEAHPEAREGYGGPSKVREGLRGPT